MYSNIAIFYEQPILSNLLRVYSLGFLIIAIVIVQKTKMSKELDFKTQLGRQLEKYQNRIANKLCCTRYI